jgi:hypothetical protein
MTAPNDMPPISPLMADIVTSLFDQSHATTNRIIENLEKQLDDARATLDAVENGILALVSGPYMPTPGAITGALYPPADIVDRYRKDLDE